MCHINLIWKQMGTSHWKIFSNFDPIINLVFALLNWLKLKLKFSGYRILNRWLSYNSQTQVDSTVFIKKQFLLSPSGISHCSWRSFINAELLFRSYIWIRQGHLHVPCNMVSVLPWKAEKSEKLRPKSMYRGNRNLKKIIH